MNMATQCLAHGARATAIRELTSTSVREVTYAELQAMTDRVAGYLQPRVAKGDRVGVLLSQTPWCAVAHLACWQIGVVSVPLFKLFKHDALKTRLQDSGASLVLTDADGVSMVQGLAEAVLIDQLQGAPVTTRAYADDEPAILIYTSGTTGSPKGALHGHGVLSGHLPGVSLSHNHLGQAEDCLWTPADWAWIGGLFDVLMPGLALGVPVVASRMQKFGVDACLDIIERGAVKNVFFPPTALRMLKADGRSVSGLRSVASGGEPLGAEMLSWGERAFGLTINEFYGQTECNMVVSSCAAEFPARPGCMGKPVPGFEVSVIDDQGLETDQEGDIAVRRGAPSMMLRYWQKPEATREKFRGDWLLTGDRGVREAGYLRFVGRDDDVITSAGYRIGPSEIEDCLLTHPAVATCGVVGKPCPLRTELVKAYVVLKPGHTVDGQTLQHWVKDRLAAHSYPRELEFLDALPMTVTGKVIRKELKQRAAAECGFTPQGQRVD